jgi:2-dehydro-3-deoxyphosphogluconate aldolase / (4S)-4-hydroxy-2-oxoglutarate aldolase
MSEKIIVDTQKTALEVQFKHQKVIPVIRTQTTEAALWLAQGLLKRGVHVLELTLTVPNVLEVAEKIKKEFPKACLGLGTLIQTEDLLENLNHGFDFYVSPVMNPAMLAMAKEHDVRLIPGCATPSEISIAHGLGYHWVKLFPISNLGGERFIKHVSAVFPAMRWMPTGGVHLKDLPLYDHPAIFAIGVGQAGCSAEELSRRDDKALDRFEKTLAPFRGVIQEAR